MKTVYIVVPKKQKEYQLTFAQLLSDNVDDILKRMELNVKDTFDTHTYCVDENRIKEKLIDNFNTDKVINELNEFVEKHQHLFSIEDRHELYHRFWIPKKSKPNATNKKDMRQIDAPNDDLKMALTDLKEIFETGCMVKYHTSCFSYVKGRSTKMALERHQANNSKWFLKLDLKNFFPNTTEDFIYQQLSQIFPFTEIIKREEGNNLLKKCINLCTLDGGLPQGTPMSPLLTNIVMIPIDYSISKELYNLNGKYCYTRYADDMLITSPYKFGVNEIQSVIDKVFNQFHCPFWLNKEKTRFGSSAGRNWNLGMMLNANNEITIGHERKRYFKAMMSNFVLDYMNGNPWSVKKTQQFFGKISYYKSIEPDYIDKKIEFFNKKYNCNIERIRKSILGFNL